MRPWSIARPRHEPPSSPLDDDALVTQDFLRRNVEDVLVVNQAGTRGHGFVFVGDLRMPATRALEVLQGRLKPCGYTPFISAEGGATWVHALPLADVVVRGRPAVNVLLFALTVLSTLAAGAFVAGSLPWLTFDPGREPLKLLDGLSFSATLLAILGTHEFGHYFTARAYGASVSLPYFIPAPPPLFLFGTLGAVIRMRSPARDRNSLFDIAAAGPLAGLAVALPALWAGLGWSRIAPVPAEGVMAFGDSLLMRFMVYLRLGALPPGMDVFVHPVALAGWVGLFVTALNLFPVGQLDGGRIAYALFGRHHRKVSVGTFLALLLLGMVTGAPSWWVFAGMVIFLIGFHHAPPLDDVTPLSAGRVAVGVLCLLLLVLLVPPVPIQLG